MAGTLRPGLVREDNLVVTEALSAPHIGSGSLQVYATPAMIALVEQTCAVMVQPYLD